MIPAFGMFGKLLGGGLTALFTYQALKELGGDAADLFGQDSSWTRPGKENRAQLSAARGGADLDMMDALQDLAEQRIVGRMPELQQLSRGTREPVGVGMMRDEKTMSDLSKLYKEELSKASVPMYPSLAEVAARTQLL